MNKEKLNREFHEFLSNTNTNAPEHLDRKILSQIQTSMLPSHTVVASKIVLVQLFVGLITLLFCPQFSLSFTNSQEVFHFFHSHLGPYGCMLACGVVFIGSGAYFSGLLLSPNEFVKIKKWKPLYYFSLSSLAVMSFLLLGAKIYLEMAVFWILGSLLGGLIFLSLGKLTRAKALSSFMSSSL